jgi:iron complex transport system substrate-binding protein
LLLCVLAICLGSWEARAGADNGICVTDHLSREVCIPQVPRRVISLAPSLTEILFALDAGNLLVGRTERCNFPPEAERVPIVGAYMNPDLERVMNLNPDLILAPQAGTRKEVITRLADLNLPVFVDDSHNLEDIRDLLFKLGHLLGRETQARHIVDEFDRVRSKVKERIKTQNEPSVLFAVGLAPLVVAGGNSFLGSMIREAGGRNIAETERTPFPKFSIEEVLRQDPDFILVLDKECPGDKCVEMWKRHRHLKAVREGKIYVLEGDLMARPSPRIGDGLMQLARILHPTAFALKH